MDGRRGALLEHAEEGSPQPGRAAVRGLSNWFGALFGIVVLVGATILYVAGGPAPPSDHEEETAADDQPAEQEQAVPVADEAGAPEAGGPANARAADPGEAEAEDGTGEGPGHGEAAAEGRSGDGLEVIEIEMVEFGYAPGSIDIEAGVPVILRFTNTGKLKHEAMVGDGHMQDEWAARSDHDDGDDHGDGEADGDGHHGDLMAVTVLPGETRDLEVTIDESGTWYMACHITGHYEQGQIAAINVTA